MSFIIRKDVTGFRLAPYTEYDDEMFTLENGEKVGKLHGWIAEPENLAAILTGGKMKTPEELTIPELNSQQITAFLKKMGMCLDHEWRIRRFMKEPFTKIKTSHIPPMIELHKKMCEGLKKNPEAMPMNVGWFDGAVGIFAGPQVMILPEVEGGEIVLSKDQMDRFRVVLKFGDWYAYPKAQRDDAPICTFMLMQFMSGTQPTNQENMEDLLGKDSFVTPEGILVGKGNYLSISVDDILGPPPEEKKDDNPA
jgi:hypothetical protein